MANMPLYQRYPNDPIYLSCISGDGTSGNPYLLNIGNITNVVNVTITDVGVPDGNDVALGATADVAATTDTGTFSLLALVKRLLAKFTTAALADAKVNPTAPTLGTMPSVFNGTTWDRARAAAANANPGVVGVPAVALHVSDNSNIQRLFAPIVLGDGVNGNNQLAVGDWLWNGASWDRVRGNVSSINLALSVATVATRTGTDQVNYNGKGILLRLKVANYANAPTFTLSLGWKTASGVYITIWTAAAAASGNGDYTYLLYPGVTTSVATETKSLMLPRNFRVVLTYAGNGTTDAADTTVDQEVIL